MEDQIFDIAFEANGQQYKGWPSDKMNNSGQPVSFHVVLQDTSFGYLSLHDCKWTACEQRPAELTEAIGKEI